MPRRLLLSLILLLGLAFQCLGQSAPLFLCEGGSCGQTLNVCCCLATTAGAPTAGGVRCAPKCGCILTAVAGLPHGRDATFENAPAPTLAVAAPPPILAVLLALAERPLEGKPALPGPSAAFGPPPYFEGAALRAPPDLRK